MPGDSFLDMVLKLLLAVGLGALIGVERETHGRPAGLRTHILVSLGAAMFTLISESFAGHSDPARIAAQVVSGIGFLGAGTIIRQGSVVRGLTTAASLWAAAAVGMGVAMGGRMMQLSVVAAFMVFITLSVLSRVEHALLTGRRARDIVVVVRDGPEGTSAVIAALAELRVNVEGVHSEETRDGKATVRIRLVMAVGQSASDVNERLTQVPQLISIDWD